MTLDAQAFPHILEAVVQFASPECLLALRGASRDLRARVDRILFEHVEVVIPTEDKHNATGMHASVRPLGSNLSFEWLARPTEDPDQDTSDPCQATPRGKEEIRARAALRAYVQERLQHACAIDLHYPQHGLAASSTKAVADAIRHLGRGPIVVRRFGEPSSTQPGYSRDFHSGLDASHQVVFGELYGSHAFDRYVCVLHCRPGDVAHGTKLLVDPLHYVPSPGRRQEMVVHLLHTDKRTWANPRASQSVMRQILWIITARFEGDFYELGGSFEMTVVGAMDEARAAVGLPASATRDEFYDAVDRMVRADVRDMSSKEVDEMYARWRRCLSFVTPDEYAAKVGARQHALETKVDPYSGPPAQYVE